MSGAAALLRARDRAHRRPVTPHRTRHDYANTMRAAALSLLALPNLTDEAAADGHALLEMVGDTLTLPRCGWYPRRPKEWKP